MEFFEDSKQHLLAELGRLDLLVRAFFAETRRLFVDDPFTKGLVIFDHEAEAYLDKPPGLPRWQIEGDERDGPFATTTRPSARSLAGPSQPAWSGASSCVW